MTTPLPRLIALCGNPNSGKTTAAEILRDNYGYVIADDGLPLRRMAIDYLGLTENHVFTQAGKTQIVDLNGRQWMVRDILGEIGNAFEEKFGGGIIPLMTSRTFEPGVSYVMASVRREQGKFWAAAGALVLEIVNPDAGVSPFEFDSFNTAYIQDRIDNSGLSRGLHPVEAREALHEELKMALGIFDLLEDDAA